MRFKCTSNIDNRYSIFLKKKCIGDIINYIDNYCYNNISHNDILKFTIETCKNIVGIENKFEK